MAILGADGDFAQIVTSAQAYVNAVNAALVDHNTSIADLASKIGGADGIDTKITNLTSRIENVSTNANKANSDLAAYKESNDAAVLKLVNASTALNNKIVALTTIVSDNKTETDASITALKTADSTNAKNISDLTSSFNTHKTTYEKKVNDLETLTAGHTTRIEEVSTNAKKANDDLAAYKKVVDASIAGLTGDYATKVYVDTAVEDMKDAILGEGVDQAFDTLKEVGDWIEQHGTDAGDMLTSINGLTTRVADVSANAIKANSDLAAYKTSNNAAVEALQNASNGLSSRIDSVNSALNSYKSSNDASITALKTADTTLNTTLVDLSTNYYAYKGTNTTNINRLNSSVTALETLVASNNSDVTEKITEVETALNNYKKVVNSSVNGLETTVANHTTEITKLINASTALNDKITALQSASTNLGNRITTLETFKGTATTEINNLKNASDGLAGRIKALEDRTAVGASKETKFATEAYVDSSVNEVITRVAALEKNQEDMEAVFAAALTDLNNKLK